MTPLKRWTSYKIWSEYDRHSTEHVPPNPEFISVLDLEKIFKEEKTYTDSHQHLKKHSDYIESCVICNWVKAERDLLEAIRSKILGKTEGGEEG